MIKWPLRIGLILAPLLWVVVLLYRPINFLLADPVEAKLVSVDISRGSGGYAGRGQVSLRARVVFDYKMHGITRRGSCFSVGGDEQREIFGFEKKLQGLQDKLSRGQSLDVWYSNSLDDACISLSWPWPYLMFAVFILTCFVGVAFSPASPLNRKK